MGGGLWTVWLIGGAGVSLFTISVPFLLPALRRHCLPYVPASTIQIEKILFLLRGRQGKVVDLGSGDGRVVSVLGHSAPCPYIQVDSQDWEFT